MTAGDLVMPRATPLLRRLLACAVALSRCSGGLPAQCTLLAQGLIALLIRLLDMRVRGIVFSAGSGPWGPRCPSADT